MKDIISVTIGVFIGMWAYTLSGFYLYMHIIPELIRHLSV